MAASVSSNSFSFNNRGNLFTFCGDDGKIKVWDTSTGTLKQDYTKNLHLSSPCTSLSWLEIAKQHGPRKKIPRSSSSNNIGADLNLIAIGTSSGNILLYDVSTNSVASELEGHSGKVNYICVSVDNNLFSCSDDKHIIEWDISRQNIKSKWKTPKERITCLLALSNGKSLLTGSYTIKLWDLENKSVIKTFVGHATEVSHLLEVPGHSSYFISAARGDRVLSAWSVKSNFEGSNALASFLLQDGPLSIDLATSTDSTSIYAVTESGALHIFKHKLNGSIKKPVKPIKNLTVASEAGEHKEVSHPIPIQAVQSQVDSNILIGYGSAVSFKFEQVVLSSLQNDNTVLIRQDKTVSSGEVFQNRTKVPIISDDVHYPMPGNTSQKRGRGPQGDVPLEARLENLALASVSLEAPKKDNMAQLLVQGLQSKDRTIIQSVLLRIDDAVIRSTVKHLPVQALVPLLKELTTLLEGKTRTSEAAVHWLITVLRVHAGALLSNPEANNLLGPLVSSVEARTSVLGQLLRLRGRVGLVTEQLSTNLNPEEEDEVAEALVSYIEEDGTDEASDGSMSEDGSKDESEDNWSGCSEEEDDEMEEDK